MDDEVSDVYTASFGKLRREEFGEELEDGVHPSGAVLAPPTNQSVCLPSSHRGQAEILTTGVVFRNLYERSALDEQSHAEECQHLPSITRQSTSGAGTDLDHVHIIRLCQTLHHGRTDSRYQFPLDRSASSPYQTISQLDSFGW